MTSPYKRDGELRRKRRLQARIARSVGYWYRRGRGVLVGEGRVSFRDVTQPAHRVESKRVDAFENMTDEELRQYVYGKKELDS